MRYIYMGTPRFAAVILQHLLDIGLPPTLVVTQPDRVAGRGRAVSPPPVKQVAQAAGLPVIQPEKITAEVRERMAAERPEIIAVAAYGKFLRPTVLQMAPHGCVNAHASLLPAYRGAAPVNWALINGESVTGVTIMVIDEGMDSGPILAAESVPIAPDDNVESLLEKLAIISGPLLVATMRRWMAGEIQASPQDPNRASFAPMLNKEDGLIDWCKTAKGIVNHLRGVNPWPGAYTTWNGKTLKVLRAKACEGAGAPGQVILAKKELVIAAGEQAVSLLEVQMENKKAMDAASFLNGMRLTASDRLGVPH